jgi:hypothetical protein
MRLEPTHAALLPSGRFRTTELPIEYERIESGSISGAALLILVIASILAAPDGIVEISTR